MTQPPPEIAAEDREFLQSFRRTVQTELARVVVGLETVIDQLLITMLAGGHLLLEGVPGTAKTTLAKLFAQVLGIQHHRIQFTPDLLPSDITGTFVFDRKANEFLLRQGPIFCQLLLADEVNRAPAKTQSALLEAMQERQVTIEGQTMALPAPFVVLATQNPVEQEGVYRLPEAQLDRFLMRAKIGYPPRAVELDIIQLHGGGGSRSTSAPTLPAQFDPAAILRLQALLPAVYAEPGLVEDIVDLARASREHADVMLGASPRAAVYLLQCARAQALLDGRHYCTHADLHLVAEPVLGHRLILHPEAEVEGRTTAQVIEELLAGLNVIKQASGTTP